MQHFSEQNKEQKMTVHRLPSMQAGCREGFRAVGAGFSWSQQRGFLVPSYKGLPGDAVGFQWDGQGLGGSWNHMHIERLMKFFASNGHQWMLSCGGNSGPSNWDSYTGQGGVHYHAWMCDPGAGNSLMIGCINLHALLHWTDADAQAVVKELAANDGYLNGAGYDGPNKFSNYLGFPPAAWCADCFSASQSLGVGGTNPTPQPQPKPPAGGHKILMLTSPPMQNTDVVLFQKQINARLPHANLTVDGVYGNQSWGACESFQHMEGLQVDGVCGAQTWAKLTASMPHPRLVGAELVKAENLLPPPYTFPDISHLPQPDEADVQAAIASIAA